MIYIRQQITGFTASNVTESYNDWLSTTAYVYESGTPTNASVARYDTWYYRSLVDANTNQSPVDFENVKWVKWQISNKMAMLDLSAKSKTIKTGGDLTVTFKQNRMDTLVVGNYEAMYITIEILDTDGTTVLWSTSTEDTLNIDVVDYYTYIYTDYGYEGDRAVNIDLPMWGEYLRVAFAKSTEATLTSCGYLVGGNKIAMGQTLYGVGLGFNSFAVKEFDDFGNLKIIKRAVQDIVDFETVIPNEEIPAMRRGIKSVYDDIVCFVVDETDNSKYEGLITLGTIQDANIVISNPTVTTVSWSIIEAV